MWNTESAVGCVPLQLTGRGLITWLLFVCPSSTLISLNCSLAEAVATASRDRVDTFMFFVDCFCCMFWISSSEL